MRRGLVTGAAAVALSALMAVGAARAFVIATTEGGDFKRWFQRGVLPFHLSTVTPEEVDPTLLESIMQTAFDAWTDTPCGTVPEVAYAGTSGATGPTTPLIGDGAPDNVVVFIRSRGEWQRLGLSPTYIAITLVAADGDSGEIVDADMLVNDGGFNFSDSEEAPADGRVDLRSVVTHEVGHFFGMDHSADVEATMYPDYSKSSDGPTAARTLAQDDIDGVCTDYTDVPLHATAEDRKDGGGCCAGGAAELVGLAGLFGRAARRRRRAL